MLHSVMSWALLAASFSDAELVDPAQVDALSFAWRSGDFTSVGEIARDEFFRLQQGRCAVSEDAARLAFLAGFAADFRAIDAPTSYLFWATERINSVTPVLDRGQREYVQARSGEPGEAPHLDAFYASSPYSAPRLRAGVNCPSRVPNQFEDPPLGTVSALYFRVTARLALDDRIYQVRFQTGYPEAESRAFAESIRGAYPAHATWGDVDLNLIANPCVTLHDAQDAPVNICRPGFEPDPSVADRR